MNIVLDDAVEEKAGGEKVRLGMVVIRGNSVIMLEVSLILFNSRDFAHYILRRLNESIRIGGEVMWAKYIPQERNCKRKPIRQILQGVSQC